MKALKNHIYGIYLFALAFFRLFSVDGKFAICYLGGICLFIAIPSA
jgi:hypothetical protein